MEITFLVHPSLRGTKGHLAEIATPIVLRSLLLASSHGKEFDSDAPLP